MLVEASKVMSSKILLDDTENDRAIKRTLKITDEEEVSLHAWMNVKVEPFPSQCGMELIHSLCWGTKSRTLSSGNIPSRSKDELYAALWGAAKFGVAGKTTHGFASSIVFTDFLRSRVKGATNRTVMPVCLHDFALWALERKLAETVMFSPTLINVNSGNPIGLGMINKINSTQDAGATFQEDKTWY